MKQTIQQTIQQTIKHSTVHSAVPSIRGGVATGFLAVGLTAFLSASLPALAKTESTAPTSVNLSYGGTGCPAGSISSSLSTDRSRLILKPSAFVVQVGQVGLVPGPSKLFDRKSCSIAIPIDVPPGYQVALGVDINGFAHVESGSANIQSESFTAGSRDLPKKLAFKAGTSKEFKISDSSAVANKFSDCGQDAILRLSSSLMIRGSGLLAVENINLKLLYRKCR
jgi:hypothetical protein